MSSGTVNCPEVEQEEFSKSATKKARKMDCTELLKKIKELSDQEKRGWEGGTKGLKQRFRDYKGDDDTHCGNILNDQRALRTYIREYQGKGCGDPPADAEELANRPLPIAQPDGESEDEQRTAKAAVAVGAGLAVAYIAYRVIRFLPSLLPPAWPTIPLNLAIP